MKNRIPQLAIPAHSKCYDDVFWPHVDKHAHSEVWCWIWTGGRVSSGYGRAVFGTKTFLAHRVSFLLAGGVLTPESPHVLHECDNPLCVNPAHLHAGNQAENNREAYTRRRHCHGERSGHAKLKAAQVIEARKAYSEGETQSSIAKRLGVSPSNVSYLINKTWRLAS